MPAEGVLDFLHHSPILRGFCSPHVAQRHNPMMRCPVKQLVLLLVISILCVVRPTSAQTQTVRVVVHDSFNVSEAVLAQFEADSGLIIEILRLGDTGILVNQSILSRENPLGDVLYGIDNTFLTRALEADLFMPYESPALAVVDPAFLLDPEARVTPINYGDVCLNVDVAYFEENDLALPQSLADLSAPEYAGLLAVQNPATSSPGLAFLLATIVVFGEEDDDYDYLDYWTDLIANDVIITDDWTTAYYSEFSGSAGSEGDRPLVVSYASSPSAEVFFADPPVETAPTSAIVAPDTCFRQVEFAGVLANASNPEGAQQFIDFLLSDAFQADMPLQMFVFPVIPTVPLPDVFAEYAAIPDSPILMPIAAIDANREQWLSAWTETALR